MNKDFVKLLAALAAITVLSGCSTTAAYSPKSMISGAEFDAMINIEVRELEPLPVENAVAATH